MLPDGSGFDLDRPPARHAGNDTPVIVLSSRDGEADRVAALETGADDYVTKPFSPREVVARVRAVLRRARAPARPERRRAAPVALDADASHARAGARRRRSSSRASSSICSRACSAEPGSRLHARRAHRPRLGRRLRASPIAPIDSHVKALRRRSPKRARDPALIETVRGVGYRVDRSARARTSRDPPGRRRRRRRSA